MKKYHLVKSEEAKPFDAEMTCNSMLLLVESPAWGNMSQYSNVIALNILQFMFLG